MLTITLTCGESRVELEGDDLALLIGYVPDGGAAARLSDIHNALVDDGVTQAELDESDWDAMIAGLARHAREGRPS